MTSFELRRKFLNFFKQKGHKIVPSSSLIPEDESVLLTTAGMQQFVPELSCKVKPRYKRVCSVQKCFRTSDIDQVGDDTHHTFFEMLGNWSFGDYFKPEAIKWALEFLTQECGLDKKRLWITVFKGNKEIPKDKESIEVWEKQGIPRERIFEFGMEHNFWGPTAEVGPCGPCSEIHYDRGKEFRRGRCSIKGCGPNCECGRFVEIWNLVFMEYDKKIKNQKSKIKNYEYVPLPQKNIDTGIGLERLTAVLQNKPSAYETDLFSPLIQEIEKNSSKPYNLNHKSYRIIADHVRGAVFLIADGVLPSNIDRGYILRRILRRAMRSARVLNLPLSTSQRRQPFKQDLQKSQKVVGELAGNWYVDVIKKIIEIYGQVYPEIKTKETDIITVIQNEEEKFSRALAKGLRYFDRVERFLSKSKVSKQRKVIPGDIVFNLYQSYGFPLEMTRELAEERGFRIDEQGFKNELKKHQEISRAGVQKKFGGVGIEQAKTEEEKIKMTRLHTATHLLHQALREVLGEKIKQMGSDINPERLRFDFSYHRKLSPEELKKVEDIVNQKIKEDLSVTMEKMPLEEAIKSGALAFFKEKYPEIVKVYSIGDFSREICAGPHVKSTGELGIFKIIKEQSSGAGVRRIRAILKEENPKSK